MKKGSGFKIAAIVAAATVGDGVFALPFIFKRSGWLLGLIYLVGLSAVIITAHVVYLATLEKSGEKERLLGLSKKYFGKPGFWLGFFSIVVGLLLVLVAYLVLGTQFIRLAAPSLSPVAALLIFWVAVSIPAFLTSRRVAELEILGITCTSLVILFVFINSFPHPSFGSAPLFTPENIFLPFGAILFALAGWTGIEPAYELRKGEKKSGSPWKAVAWGTIIAALLKIMFITGILGSAPVITADTISGLANWPLWKREIIAILGFLAVWTIFLPISREVKNAIEKDLRVHPKISRSIIVLFPLALVAMGFNNFLVIVEVVGGIFLSIQYLLIVAVGRQALKLSAAKKAALDGISLIFIAAAVYSVYQFVVR